MAIIDYPYWLPLPQKASKNMTFDTPFRTDEPAIGKKIYQKLTDDIGTTWSVVWIFDMQEDRAFNQWIRSANYLDNCNNSFRMPIKIGGAGLQVQTLHFVSFPIQTTTTHGTTQWTGTVYADKIVNSDDAYDDMLVELSPAWWDVLDIVVNKINPKYKDL